jgi:alpha-N-arabinofuranosidase
MWGPWQVGQQTKEDYAKQAAQWGKALKLLDPNIILILCGQDGYSYWDQHVLKECIQVTDMHSIHTYTTSDNHIQNVIAPRSAERSIEITAGLIDLARINANIPSSVPRVSNNTNFITNS